MTTTQSDAFDALRASSDSRWISPAITKAADLARQAREAGNDNERVRLLNQSIGFNRSCREAYLLYSQVFQKHNLLPQAALCLEEANRIAELDESDFGDLVRLRSSSEVKQDSLYQSFQSRAFPNVGRAEKPLRILVVTNLLPPQEMGGFGRTVWEFGQTLIARGHDVKLLCADLPHLLKEADSGHRDMERFIERNLRLFGDWQNGRCVPETDAPTINAVVKHNRDAVRQSIASFHPDVCMVGNLDFLGVGYMGDLVRKGIPIVHRLGNESPGYPVASTPTTGTYVLAGCSQWLNQKIKSQGYPIAHYEVVYPSSPIEDYYRAFPPEFSALRICFASLLMPYKGCQILIEALQILHGKGIDFTCEIAGDTVDLPFVQSLAEKILAAGFAEKVRFLGFLGRNDLRDLYARSNVLVFPSVFEEPFGKTQIEAMAAGLIPVTSGTGGSREIVTHGKDGFHFRNGDAASLASVLEGIAKLPPSETLALSKRAVRRSSDFTNKRSVMKLEEIFAKALNQQYRSPPKTTPTPPQTGDSVMRNVPGRIRDMQHELDDLKSIALLPDIHKKLFIPWTSSAIRPSSLRLVLNEIAIHNKRVVVELGSGISTLFIADLARELGFAFYSVDDNADWQGVVGRQLVQLNVPADTVTFVEAPLHPSELSKDGLTWYSEEQLSQVFEKAPPIDMMLVDGPIAAWKGCEQARFPAVPFFRKYMSPDCSVFLDDCNRRGETEILSDWAARFGFQSRLCSDFGNIGFLWRGNKKRFNIF